MAMHEPGGVGWLWSCVYCVSWAAAVHNIGHSIVHACPAQQPWRVGTGISRVLQRFSAAAQEACEARMLCVDGVTEAAA